MLINVFRHLVPAEVCFLCSPGVFCAFCLCSTVMFHVVYVCHVEHQRIVYHSFWSEFGHIWLVVFQWVVTPTEMMTGQIVGLYLHKLLWLWHCKFLKGWRISDVVWNAIVAYICRTTSAAVFLLVKGWVTSEGLRQYQCSSSLCESW